MTLPFRRRHHDDETAHDRARLIWSNGLLEPIEPADESWLEAHLAGCGECRLEREGYLEDRELLRALREIPPAPPRDLWARTAAAIEQESGRGRRRSSAIPLSGRLVPQGSRFPLGVMSGLLVVVVVIAVSLAPHGIVAPGQTPGNSGIAAITPPLQPSPVAVDTATLGWLQQSADGSYDLNIANVNEVCPDEKAGCAPLGSTTQNGTALELGSLPQAIVASPRFREIVVVAGSSGTSAGTVTVVPVPTRAPEPTIGPTVAAATTEPSPATAAPSLALPSLAAPSASPAAPGGAHDIAAGVVVVGDTAYSPDGTWLAFSARPIDGSSGPDLYVWHVGDASARAVTSNHATYFSGWLDGRILASRVLPAADASAAPSDAPGAASTAGPVPSLAPEAHPASFLFDPAKRTSVDLAVADVWLPAVDRTGRFATYWSGTLVPNAAGTGWMLGTGHLVLDGWTEPLSKPDSSDGPSAASPSGAGIGPVGKPVELVAGPIATFEARFDPTGTRLAVWVADAADPTVGTLTLVVLDHTRGRIDPKLTPLSAVRALHGISIDQGRLAWVTPPGQDGQQSVVQVLAWSNDAFGQVETVPGEKLYIVR